MAASQVAGASGAAGTASNTLRAIGQQPQQVSDGTPIHCERHRPEQITLYRLVQQPAAAFFVQPEDAAGADLPQFVKDEFNVRRAN